jgi:quercetin dioxygenase-like cupin family protein
MSRQMVHTEQLTVARLVLKKGAAVPEHRHVNEQFSIIESGALQFTLGERKIVVRGGESLAIGPNEPHAAEALEDTCAIDIFTPPRQDWISGDDAYLRGR